MMWSFIETYKKNASNEVKYESDNYKENNN